MRPARRAVGLSPSLWASLSERARFLRTCRGANCTSVPEASSEGSTRSMTCSGKRDEISCSMLGSCTCGLGRGTAWATLYQPQGHDTAPERQPSSSEAPPESGEVEGRLEWRAVPLHRRLSARTRASPTSLGASWGAMPSRRSASCSARVHASVCASCASPPPSGCSRSTLSTFALKAAESAPRRRLDGSTTATESKRSGSIASYECAEPPGAKGILRRDRDGERWRHQGGHFQHAAAPP